MHPPECMSLLKHSIQHLQWGAKLPSWERSVYAHVCVCLHVCACVLAHVCMHVYLCKFACVCVFAYVCIHVCFKCVYCVHAYAYGFACVCSCVFNMSVYVCACMCMHPCVFHVCVSIHGHVCANFPYVILKIKWFHISSQLCIVIKNNSSYVANLHENHWTYIIGMSCLSLGRCANSPRCVP